MIWTPHYHHRLSLSNIESNSTQAVQNVIRMENETTISKFSQFLRIKKMKAFSLTLGIVVVFQICSWSLAWKKAEERKKLQIPPDSLNYFMDNRPHDKLEYVVNTERCKIMKFSPWDSAIQPFIRKNVPPTDCFKYDNASRLIYQEGTTLFINETAVINEGYSMSSLKCCYKGIIRVKQLTYMFGARNADSQVKYTDSCIKMDPVTIPQYEFVRVDCSIPRSWSWLIFMEQVVYTDFFAVPMLKKIPPSNKRDFWATQKILPPSVVLIGIDSMSRMNYHRSLTQTKEFMDSHGAIEMMGYTKIGENTYPNAVAFLSGLDLLDPEVPYECIRNAEKVPQDSCPYIWKRFNDSNYLTALVEDYPGIMTFNHMKMGFVEQPTDFYFRPFMLSIDQPNVDCIGQNTTEATLMKYISGAMSHSSEIPIFVHSWLTGLGHGDMNQLQLADKTIFNFLTSVNLTNTILILLSDHGQRYNALRKTLPGWYEDKLPAISIYLPPIVKTKFPEWETNLQVNSMRLTSPYDLYQTMEHILTSYNSALPNLPPFHRGQSLLTPISRDRRCIDARIGINFCACIPPKRLNSTDPKVQQAAVAAVTYLNNALPSQCHRTELDTVIAGAEMLDDENNVSKGSLIVSFYTNPGQFLFEATVDFTVVDGHHVFKVGTDLLRMNKMERSADCVNTPTLERYCYCK